jgi:hypothetical protein
MPKLFISLILVVVLTISGLLAVTNAVMSQYLTAFISLSALVVSVVSAFKDDIFPFKPRVLFGEVVLTTHPGLPEDSPTVLLPLVFINEGHGSGIIEGLTLEIESGKTVKVYTPVLKVDYQKFFSGKRTLHDENLLGAFNVFPLGSRETLKKSIAFTQEEKSTRYPFSTWSPGPHVFRLYLKHSGRTLRIEVGAITKEINSEMLADYKAGVSISLTPTRELCV